MKTGNTPKGSWKCVGRGGPQWSPVMKTGNTSRLPLCLGMQHIASMEPGHEDREYLYCSPFLPAHQQASMEPGHEDREYKPVKNSSIYVDTSLNGARS